jgi:hypothetical protein
MNTREKIMEDAGVLEGPLTVATAYFDPLLAWHAERLQAIREDSGKLAAIVLPLEGSLLAQRARAELAASLRAIDYVFISPTSAATALIHVLRPARVFRLEEEELRARSEWMAHVRSL